MPKEKGPMMTEAFWAWLDAVMKDRNLKPADVSKLAGINESVLSKARNGGATIGVDALTKIADGLEFPRVLLLRLGGWIPANESPMGMVWEVQSLWDELDEDDQEEIAAILRVKVKNARRKKDTARKASG